MKLRQNRIPASSKFRLVESADLLVEVSVALGRADRAAAYRTEVESLKKAQSSDRHY